VWTETDPQRKQQIATARTAYQEAAKLQQDGKPAEALARCESLPDDCRNNYYACQAQELAINMNQVKSPAKAVEGHLAFVARWPAHPECGLHLYQAGYLLEATVDDVPRAIQVYQQCVDAYPQDRYAVLCLDQMARVWMYKQMYIDYARARDAFLKLAETYAHFFSYNARLARKSAADCQMQLRDTQKARAMYLQLMNEDPNDYASYLAASSGYTWIRMRKDAP
jgi:tetratricopeptide (TPR) repeat protein